ncbi:DUF3566 domain-containing protein [Mycolicibacterium thermoresistibile]
MSSPNEPGYPRTGERPPGANGSGPGHEPVSADRDRGTESRATDVRPTEAPTTETRAPDPLGTARRGGPEPAETSWQRGPTRGSGGHRAPEPPTRSEAPRSESGSRPDGPRPVGPRGATAGGEARGNRFTPGMPGATSEADQRHDHADGPARGDAAYASELPDLSGPVPRPPQRKPGPERPTGDHGQRSAPTSRIQVANRPRGPVRASMQIRRVDPWSVLKVSLVLSVALFFVWMIAVAFLYLVLGGMGVWSKLNSNVGDLLTSASGTTGGELVSSGTIFGGAALIGLVNIVLLSAMATIGAFVYNLTTDLVGGVEVTLADRD